MANAWHSNRKAPITRRVSKIKQEKRMLRELVADLPFSRIILLQELLERQYREIRPKKGLITSRRQATVS